MGQDSGTGALCMGGTHSLKRIGREYGLEWPRRKHISLAERRLPTER
ncbi:protein of unknown function [Azospirillum lipoferum 4B]|uniref:Uncharacterized protein n=1 Tax=Azospirillum lipoferum (strain 4B) TaxID=862719 RepID=G7Z3C7_AZOL4|nr:protein of unknown function [Azospirillum lipoferum 4B]